LGQVLNDGRAIVERKCREKHFPDKITVSGLGRLYSRQRKLID